MAKDDTGSGEGVTGGQGGGSGGQTEEATMESSARGRVQAALGWPERAEEAEKKVEDLNTKVVALEQELATARAALAQLETRHRLERELEQAGAVDLQTAILLAELELTATEDANVESTVDALRTSKPYLFQNAAHGAAPSPWPSPGAISAAMTAHAPKSNDALTAAAAEAASTGDRAALLRYLQLRRRGA
ncbi:MAG: hypothetical protein KDA20_09280 [Phycisphaerales bacterium]|nr:hypothetical protein [Phycisphaerales bacterium]